MAVAVQDLVAVGRPRLRPSVARATSTPSSKFVLPQDQIDTK